MLDSNFVILGAIISFIGALSYLKDTLSGKAKPNRVTFFLWTLAPFIAFLAEIKQGVGIHALLTFMMGFNPLLILIASFISKKAEWKLTKFDLSCGALSLLGLFLWYVSKNPDVAILFAIIADGLAALPTIVKSYYYPETENYFAYLGGACFALITLLTITIWNFPHVGFPIYILVVNLILFFFIKFKIGKHLNDT